MGDLWVFEAVEMVIWIELVIDDVELRIIDSKLTHLPKFTLYRSVHTGLGAAGGKSTPCYGYLKHTRSQLRLGLKRGQEFPRSTWKAPIEGSLPL